jgi:hypothetical protein
MATRERLASAWPALRTYAADLERLEAGKDCFAWEVDRPADDEGVPECVPR